MHSLEYYQNHVRELEERILEEIDDEQIKPLLVEYIECLECIVVIRAEIE